jgi:hypothetical protein
MAVFRHQTPNRALFLAWTTTHEEPMNDLNGWGTARKMIELYGKEAQTEARRRCEKALQRDDLSGFERWAHLATVIGGQLSRSAVEPAQLVH